MRRHPILGAAALLAAASLGAEDVLKLPIGDPARRGRDVPVVLDAITDTGTGALIGPSDLPGRLAGVRLVLVGEGHTDMDSHRVEKRVVEELAGAGRRVVVGLEMYPYPEQSVLDDWSAGKLSEDEFVKTSHWYRNWGYNWAYYRDIFLFVRDRHLGLVAINAPREVVTAVRKKGFQGLTAEEAAHIPTRIDSVNADHLRLFKASFDDDSFHAGTTDEQWQAMLNAQCTWDATMAFHAVQPLLRDDDPGTVVVVLVGAGHVQYGLGIERQAKQWFSGPIASVVPVSVKEEKKPPTTSVRASYASFVWGLPPETDSLYPDLGVSTRPLSPPDPGGPLLQVIHVDKDSCAAKAGLKEDDVLLTFDGAPVPEREVLNRLMSAKRWGDGAVLTVRRGADTAGIRIAFRREGPAPSKP